MSILWILRVVTQVMLDSLPSLPHSQAMIHDMVHQSGPNVVRNMSLSIAWSPSLFSSSSSTSSYSSLSSSPLFLPLTASVFAKFSQKGRSYLRSICKLRLIGVQLVYICFCACVCVGDANFRCLLHFE